MSETIFTNKNRRRLSVVSDEWRRGRDSNPCEPLSSNGFQDRPVMTTSVPLHIFSTQSIISYKSSVCQ